MKTGWSIEIPREDEENHTPNFENRLGKPADVSVDIEDFLQFDDQLPVRPREVVAEVVFARINRLSGDLKRRCHGNIIF